MVLRRFHIFTARRAAKFSIPAYSPAGYQPVHRATVHRAAGAPSSRCTEHPCTEQPGTGQPCTEQPVHRCTVHRAASSGGATGTPHESKVFLPAASTLGGIIAALTLPRSFASPARTHGTHDTNRNSISRLTHPLNLQYTCICGCAPPRAAAVSPLP